MKGAGQLIRVCKTVPMNVSHLFTPIAIFGAPETMGNKLPPLTLPFPRKLRDALIAAGRAEPHHVLPQTGWVSCWMAGPGDATGVIELFKIQYDRYAAAAGRAPHAGEVAGSQPTD